MVVVVRMKNVTRFLLFMGSLVAWFVLLVLANDTYLFTRRDEVLIVAALVVGALQTWLLAYLLRT